VVDRMADAILMWSAVALRSMRIDGELINEGTRRTQVSGNANIHDRQRPKVRE
jgi:hypothetical protein